jgi:predicted esterase
MIGRLGLAASALGLVLWSGSASAEVRLVPSARGVVGAWMVAGPFPAAGAGDAAPAGVKWKLVASGNGDPGSEGARAVDLKSSLDNAGGKDLVAYARGRLHVETAGRYFLLLGVDDGVRVSVDGKVVYTRDEGRPLREDDDIVGLDLAAGEHDLSLKLHQRDGAWVFRARFVDDRLAPPKGAWLELPGTNDEDARQLASKMSWLVVDRAFDGKAGKYRPILTVRYPEGAPNGVPIAVSAKVEGVFDLNVGGMTGASDLVVSLPPMDPWSGTVTLESVVAGRVVKSSLVARPASEAALARMDKALANTPRNATWLGEGSLDSARHLARRLARFVARGDQDAEAQADEAKELDALAADLEKGVDPYAARTGVMRRALVTPFDAAPSEYGFYVPPSYRASPGSSAPPKKYPLIIGLHGMNSAPMSIMRALFGQDDEKKDTWFKDRHPVPLPPVEAFVITPNAHGNTMYREIGEDDVLFLMEWAKRNFPIDASRITITGPSMGGIGSAALPFHYPGLFAAAEPLCGYHSYWIRPELGQRAKRPWEKHLLDERSNVLWAENGEHLPLYIVHGTRDLPEANSGVLIERYEKLKYSVKHEHPDAGHNVWGPTYGDLKGIKWLLEQRLPSAAPHVHFRTMKTRYAKSGWVTVDELSSSLEWADIDATRSKDRITVTAAGAAQLTLSVASPVTVAIEGTTLSFAADEPVVMHKSGASWEKGAAAHAGAFKHGRVMGPIRDVFHEPITFVYADGDEARANLQVAKSFAERPGIPASYPVMSDTDFLARKEPLANERALFLIGRDNKVLKALEAEATTPFPIRVEPGAVAVAGQRITGREVGAAFIHPNPLRPDRYVVVVAGADVAGMLRAESLPEFLPDFVVWDAALAPARGQVLLGSATLRAGGMFNNDWTLPASIADPLAR